jgi:hypothetical protein
LAVLLARAGKTTSVGWPYRTLMQLVRNCIRLAAWSAPRLPVRRAARFEDLSTMISTRR